jgi:HK97 family phage prohead protease
MTKENDREVRIIGPKDWEIRHTGRATEGFTIRGYPAVYNQPSLDLGGFTEQIAPGAFDEVLAATPDVHFVWDHDTRYVGARTTNGTLSLSSDDHGLFMEAQVGNYSWAKDLRVALERGDIDQGSFAFTVADGGDTFAADDDGNVTRTITNVGGLYDVTVTAQGADPQTSMAAVRSLAAATGRQPEEAEAALVAPSEEGQREEEQERSVEDDEDFARWHAAMETKFAARRAVLAKQEQEIPNEREDA